MSDKKRKTRTDADLSEEELEKQKGDHLPDREVMSRIGMVAPDAPVPTDELDGLMPTDPIPKP